MKEIKYPGSLTNDLETIHEKEQDSLFLLLKLLAEISILLVIGLAISGLIGEINPTIFSSIFSSITSITLITTVRRSGIAVKNLTKSSAKMRISSLVFSLYKYNMGVDRNLIRDDVYQADDIENAVVIEKSRERVIPEGQNTPTEKDIDAYIEEVISDIYFVNKDAKIKVLREIKDIVTTHKGNKIPKEICLYELEDEEVDTKTVMLKHILKLKEDKHEKN